MDLRKVIYKITYPNGKIYVGQDRTDSANYFGSAKSSQFLKDFSQAERDNFTVRKQVIWSSTTATNEELNRKEVELIIETGANDPKIGYNLKPKFKAV
ncbi:hypothetical protein AQS8620_02059 [Aquimixticola soesokkakensis]|uniref:GIY-YIG domain-containing protein n=1 Tax=Aquimixticola soesokkakensis TaxID=1519096 RepID=A0A1Y5SV73_9RHOB|nr:hypothetical protein [Aquimixticola soesokkakensis]SLN48804.1 hypothetical protein AQS8620_02059 [Aquimixticola soesokkakensis]